MWKGLDIGTAKPSLEERRRVPHHLIDILDIDQPINLGLFLELADRAEQEIRIRGKMPIACGGTIYYLRHFLFGSPATPPVDPAIRALVNDLEHERGPAGLRDLLRDKDPLSYQRIHPNDLYRIKRALEVVFQTGSPLSSFAERVSMVPRLPVIVLDVDKNELALRIRHRCEVMFQRGWVEEVEGLLHRGASPFSPGLQSIGYFEITRDLLQGKNPRESLEEIVLRTQQLAKRQLTFLRSLRPAIWVPPQPEKILSALETLTLSAE